MAPPEFVSTTPCPLHRVEPTMTEQQLSAMDRAGEVVDPAALSTPPAVVPAAPSDAQIITLCGSARFERLFKAWNEALTMAGHTVFSLTAYPSDKAGVKQWYTEEQKAALDAAHFRKIAASNAIFVLNLHAYIGESTLREIEHARQLGKTVYFLESWGKGNGISRAHTDEAQHAAEADGLTIPTASPIDTTTRSGSKNPWAGGLLGPAGAFRSAIVDLTKNAALSQTMRPAVQEQAGALLTDTDLARVYRRVTGANRFDQNALMLMREVEHAVNEKRGGQEQEGGLTQQLVTADEAIAAGHDPFCLSVLRGKACDCGVASREEAPATPQAAIPAAPSEREAFEAWAKQYGRIFLDRQPHGNYMHAYTQEAWVGWQARAALAQPAPVAAPALASMVVTEDMHVAAIKVLQRASGLDGLPQRMLDAMLAVAAPAAPAPASEAVAWQKRWNIDGRGFTEWSETTEGKIKECLANFPAGTFEYRPLYAAPTGGESVDAVLLDWLDRNGRVVKHSIGYRGTKDGWCWTDERGQHHDAPSLRDAILAARAALQTAPPQAGAGNQGEVGNG